MNRRLCFLAIVAVAFTAPAVTAQPAGTPIKTGPDAEIEKLLREHEESDLGYVRSYEAFLPRFEALAEKHRGTEAEVRAVLWQVQQTWWLRPKGTMEETSLPLAEYLLEERSDSPQLDLLVEYQYCFTKRQRNDLFEKLLAVSPHRTVQAAAHFGLAKLKRTARDQSGAPDPHWAALLEEYADEPWRLTTYGVIANAYLNPHPAEALAVGKPAPEIEGVDENRKPKKLSDYRGKVVLLDFWGHW